MEWVTSDEEKVRTNHYKLEWSSLALTIQTPVG